MLLVGWVVLNSLGGNDTGGPSGAIPTSQAATPSPSVTAIPGIGVPVRDGQLQFTVTNVQCGVDELKVGFFPRHPDGQYCLAAVTASNIGGSDRTLSLASQSLYDTAGARHGSDQLLSRASFSNELWGNISEGETVSGTFVFDIPVDAAPDHLELHDGPFSGGVTVPVR